MRYIAKPIGILAAVASIFLGGEAALAQGNTGTYPSRPVTMIVPIAAGGPMDSETRLYAPVMTEALGQTFLIDYRPGAGTTIGVAYVAKAAPDGYTILVNSGGLTIIPALYSDLTFDVVKDFAPISLMTEKPTVLVVNSALPVKSFAEYIAYAKANPGKLNFGTTGAGSTSHLVGAWMHNSTNTKVAFVHYKGAAPQVLDLVAGRVDSTATTLTAVMPHIKSGKLRALAITNDKRTKLMPDLPTIAEQGIPGFNYTNWQGVLVPAATPAAIVSRLNEGFVKVAKTPSVISKLESEGNNVVGSTPAQFKQMIVAEVDRWKKLVQETGIKLEE